MPNLASISATNIMEFPVIFPPRGDQVRILSHLGGQTANLDMSVAEVGRAIAQMEEFRTTLIDAAVTGKIRVDG